MRPHAGRFDVITLSHVATRVPERREPVERILADAGCSVAEQRMFTRVYRLRQSPVLAADESLPDLLAAAGREALGDGGAELVLYGHTLLAQEFGRGELPGLLRAALGLPGVPFAGLSQVGCTSVLRAIELARRFLLRRDAGQDETVLVLGGDHGSMDARARVVPGMTVGGDAAVAVAVRRGGGRYRWLGSASRRDTRFHRSLHMDAGELRLFGRVCRDHVVDTVVDALASAGLTLADVDWVMPHLSNALFWKSFSAGSGVPLDRVCLGLISEQGHTFGADALFALDHADREGRLATGDRCVLISLGQGAYFSAHVVEIAEVP